MEQCENICHGCSNPLFPERTILPITILLIAMLLRMLTRDELNVEQRMLLAFYVKKLPMTEVVQLGCRTRQPYCVTQRSAAARLLGLQVRKPVSALMFVSCVYVLRSQRTLRRAALPFRGVQPRVRVRACLVMCSSETSTTRRPGPKLGCSVTENAKGQQGLLMNKM